jgi:hypothetical protein
MVFTRAWCCQLPPPPALLNGVVTTTRGRTLDATNTLDDVLEPAPDSSDGESSVGPPPLGPRYDESSDDESSIGHPPPLVPRSANSYVDDDELFCSFQDSFTDDDASL